jgi:hypothetical protein
LVIDFQVSFVRASRFLHLLTFCTPSGHCPNMDAKIQDSNQQTDLVKGCVPLLAFDLR